ncbi:hypothetical protein CsSME_00042506 [Camellia sinensis var. sinensis]
MSEFSPQDKNLCGTVMAVVCFKSALAILMVTKGVLLIMSLSPMMYPVVLTNGGLHTLNYVVQFVFEIEDPWATVDILDQLEGDYGDLSMQKYSSNVVEKCLKYAGEESQSCIIHELINNRRLDQIMQDPYGNYVIQAALNHSKPMKHGFLDKHGVPVPSTYQGSLHAALVEAIRPHVPVLRTSPYGKKVLSSNGLKK